MKKICFVAMASLLLFWMPGFCKADSLAEYMLVAENQHLALYIHPDNTAIAVADQRTGTVWFSNPENWQSNEKIARGRTKERLGAQVSITYFDNRDIRLSMDNYNDSIKYLQFEITPIEQGVRVDYVLGKQWDDKAYLPKLIDKSRFEELVLNRVSEQERQLFAKCYTLVRLVETSEEVPSLDLFNVDPSVFEDYTLVAEEQQQTDAQRRRLTEHFIDLTVENRQDLAARTDVSEAHISLELLEPAYIINRNVLNWDLEDMIAIIKELGLSPAEMQADYPSYGWDLAQPNVVTFSIPIEYRLDGDNLLVRIPIQEIKYPDQVVDQSGKPQTYPLYTISVLEYFGAADSDAEGYIFVPDGSGALIYLNNGRTNASAYTKPVYGRDLALDPPQILEPEQEQVYMPVFGIKNGSQAVFAIVEQGISVAAINADIAGRVTSYNNAYPTFRIIPYAVAGLEAQAEWRAGQTAYRNEINVYQPRKTSGDILIRYAFLYENEAGYVGMARYYQEYLEKTQGLQQMGSADSIPLFLELVGAVGIIKPVLGVPREVIEPLTTYSQAKEIANAFLKAGTSNLVLRYLGWMEGGLHHRYPKSVYLESKLGGKRQFMELVQFAQEQQIAFHPDVNFMEIYRDSWFDGFSPAKHGARFLSREVAKIYEENRILNTRRNKGVAYIISPGVLPGLAKGFASSLEKWGITGASLSGFGSQLNSDFRHSTQELIDREQARQLMQSTLENLREDFNLNLLVDGANDYALPYANGIVRAPLTSSDYFIIDESVPFYAIVIHGYIPYAGEPVNLAGDHIQNLLKSIEHGAYPCYQMIYADTWTVKDTKFNHLYSVNFDDWFADAVEFYTKANRVLQPVIDSKIVDHRQLQPNVYQTVYENGFSVIVNYNQAFVEIDGITVPGKDFLLVEGANIHE